MDCRTTFRDLCLLCFLSLPDHYSVTEGFVNGLTNDQWLYNSHLPSSFCRGRLYSGLVHYQYEHKKWSVISLVNTDSLWSPELAMALVCILNTKLILIVTASRKKILKTLIDILFIWTFSTMHSNKGFSMFKSNFLILFIFCHVIHML